MNIDHLTVFVCRELGVTQLDPGLGSHSYDVLRGCQHLAVQLGVGEPMANGWRPQSLTMWASSPTASCDLMTARPADLSPSSAVPAPQLGELPCTGRSRGSGSDVYQSPALPTFWARASSSAWISNSPSSESLLWDWDAAPRRFRSPFFFFHWAMVALPGEWEPLTHANFLAPCSKQ